MAVPDPAAAVLPSPGPRRRELTARALIFGCVAGALLSAGNVYTGLKTGINDGCSIASALLAFAFFSSMRRFSPAAFGPLENNIAQTTAAAAAIMGFSMGITSAFPALTLMGQAFAPWALPLWGAATGVVGILLAGRLRDKLIRQERLPFPTGAATGEVIAVIGEARDVAMRRATLLVGAAVIAMVFTWFRDGRPALIPQMWAVDVAIAGISLPAIGVGLGLSPLMLSTGLLIGERAAFSILASALIGWVGLVPPLVRAGVIRSTNYGDCVSWLTWPGVGMLLASAFVPLVFEWRGLARGLGDVARLASARGAAKAGAATSPRWATPLLVVAVAVVVTLSVTVFHTGWMVAVVGLGCSVVLANVCARTTGETDFAPVGPLSTVTLLALTGRGVMGSVVGASVVMGTASQTIQTLWAFKAGDRFDATPRAQMTAQLVGCLVGGLAAVPAYLLIVRAYGLASTALPSPAALSWKATAQAMQNGLATLPPHAPTAGAIGFGLGVALTLLSRTRVARFLPSPGAMGTGMLMPFSLALTASVGGLVLLVARRRSRATDFEANVAAIAAGGIAGESIMGVVVAALMAAGVLASP